MTTSYDVSDVVARGEPTLIDLHAKLLLPDADIRDLHGALIEDQGCTWSIVDPDDHSLLPVTDVDVDARLTVVVRRRAAGTAKWKPFLSGLGVPLGNAAAADNESVLIVAGPQPARPGHLCGALVPPLLWCRTNWWTAGSA